MVVAAGDAPAQSVSYLPLREQPALVSLAVFVCVHEREQPPDRDDAHPPPQRFVIQETIS